LYGEAFAQRDRARLALEQAAALRSKPVASGEPETDPSVDDASTLSQADKPVALVCHAPGVLRHAKAPDGRPLVEGKAVTGFTNTEEEAVGLTAIVPFLVEDELKRNGGVFSKAGD